MEEYAEAMLYLIWREEGKLPTIKDVGEGGGGGEEGVVGGNLHITPVEYIGGLVDFTGEVGRYAVARATERDVE